MVSSRATVAVVGALVAALLAPGPLPAVEAQEPVQTPIVGADTPEGVTISPLAGVVVDELAGPRPSTGLMLVLERVPLRPQEAVDGRDPTRMETEIGPVALAAVGFHLHLLFVEAGEVVLGVEGNEQTRGEGDQVLVPAETPYEIRNDSDECASVLRLSAGESPQGMGSSAQSVTALPETCGEPRTLLFVEDIWPEDPEAPLLFIAKMSWDEGRSGFHNPGFTHPGAVGLVVESGTLVATDTPCCLQVQMYLTAGGSVAVPAGVRYSVWSDELFAPSEALMVGVIPVDQDLFIPAESEFVEAPAPTPTAPTAAETESGERAYTSPTYGYRLAWDESWSVVEESSDAGFDRLHLTNGTSLVWLDGYAAFGGDPVRCLTDAVQRLEQEPGVSALEAMEDSQGQPIQGVEETSAFALYAFTYAPEGGAERELVQLTICHTAVPGEAVLEITQIVDRADYEGQVLPMDDLLASLNLAQA